MTIQSIPAAEQLLPLVRRHRDRWMAVRQRLRHGPLVEGGAEQERWGPEVADGAMVHPHLGWADVGHGAATGCVVASVLLAMLNPSEVEDERSLARSVMILDAMLVSRRAGGLIDNPDCNIDSPPDTAFVVQELGVLLMLADERGLDHPRWHELRTRIVRWIGDSLHSIAVGGFHTPNHRWVIVSALAIGLQLGLVGDREAASIKATIERYLAEGPDLDEHGFFVERSPVVYDAVSCRSLLLLDHFYGAPAFAKAAEVNLITDSLLLNPDGSIESALSIRQDRWSRKAPTGLAACAVLLDRVVGEHGLACDLSGWLWQLADQFTLTDLNWLVCAGLLAGRWAVAGEAVGQDGVGRVPVLFDVKAGDGGAGGSERADGPQVQGGPLLRWRSKLGRGLEGSAGGVALSVLAGQRCLMRGVWAGGLYPEQVLRLEGLYLRVSYFGSAGDFVATEAEAVGDGFRLRCDGLAAMPRRPGYELPLGYPVAAEDWDRTLDDRSIRALPPASGVLGVDRSDPGVVGLSWACDGELPTGVAAQIAMDFALPARLEARGLGLVPADGQIVRLMDRCRLWSESGLGLEVDGGSDEHRAMVLRDGPPLTPVPGVFRLVINLKTPINHRWSLRLV